MIDLVEFPNGLTQSFTEKSFNGSIQKQLTDILAYISSNIIKTKVIKHKDREKSDRFINYPFDAIEEALANAVYHKNYELAEPIEVRILPASIEIISYNGVDPSIKQSEFDAGRVRARRYRNRRIGEFLKELKLTEGRGTGIPTIVNALKENGSPAPIFDINDPERTHFIVEIPIHPAFIEEENRNFHETSNDQVSDQVSDQVISILTLCLSPKSRQEILTFIGITNQTKNFNTHVLPLLQEKWIDLTIKDNPKDRNQKYVTSDLGKSILASTK
jgi:ATP-dependent DNA helicase RecG